MADSLRLPEGRGNMQVSIFKGAAVAAALLAAAPALAQTSFTENDRNGVCYFTMEGGPKAPGTDKPMGLEFSYRVRDGNMGATILVNGWPKAQSADSEAKVPVTVVTDKGKTNPSRSGGYNSGFNDRLWSGWGPAELSAPLFELLKTASSATIEADGMKMGPFKFQKKGQAHAALSTCIARVKAAG